MWTDKFLSPSRCDTFTQYTRDELYSFGDRPDFDTDMFIDKLLKIEDPRKFRKANAGSAFHSLLENAGVGELLQSVIINDWQINIECDAEFYLPECREIWVRGKINENNIVGKVDAINANTVHDIKTTGQIDLNKYIDSWQWRMYLYLTGCSTFVYDLFKVKVDDEVNIVTIQDYQRLQLDIYPEMRHEVENMIEHYVNTLLILKDRIIARVTEYNAAISAEIDRLNEMSNIIVSCAPELQSLAQQLKNKFISVKGLTCSN